MQLLCLIFAASTQVSLLLFFVRITTYTPIKRVYIYYEILSFVMYLSAKHQDMFF
jgi:hypothetical protein